MSGSVTIIVPSFNRAHLLPLTLPSYLQPEVNELILVDDCSVDNTEAVVKGLQQKYPQIRYFKNAVNSKQGFSKNVGLEHATGDYIYFGDDDSLITKDTIKILLETLQNYNADVVSARTLFTNDYFTSIKDLDKFVKWIGKKRVAKNEKEICDLENMRFNFCLNFYKPINVSVAANAPAILRTRVAKQFKFDPAYIGSAYREETDYWAQVALAGYKFMFNPKAVQVNLPPKMVKLTGARSGGFKVWKESAIRNNQYFLDKNWAKICKKFGYTTKAEDLQNAFIANLGDDFPIDSKLKAFLKRFYFKMFVLRIF